MATDFRYLIDRILLNWRTPDSTRQVGAIPYAIVEGRVAFLLITSRRSGRWIFPKGSILQGLSATESAAQEALEEAGVTGEIALQPVGCYRAIKKGPMTRSVMEVDMYPMRVTEQHQTWQEMNSRHRHWALLPEVRRLLSDPDLAELAAKLNRQIVSTAQSDTTIRIMA